MATLSREVYEPVVLLGGAKQKKLKIQSVYRGIGGQQLDHAYLYWDTSEKTGRGDLLHDLNIAKDFVGEVVEVYIDTEAGRHFVHAGQVSEVRPRMNADTLSLEIVSKVQPYHFGDPIYGMQVRQLSASYYFIDDDLVFNPEIDGKVVGNMSHLRHPKGHHYFLDVESSRTTQALAFQQQPPNAATVRTINQWTLAKAAHYLMWVANPLESFAANWHGNVAQLEQLLDFQPLRNQRLPSGMHLMEALDTLLSPYGWRPFLGYSGQGRRQIRFMRIGDKTQPIVNISHQRDGAKYDPSKTHIEELNVRERIDDRLVNDLTVRGDWIYVESSFELYRAWPTELDATAYEDLTIGSDNYIANPSYARVYRDFVLNEAGDYNKLRAEITAPYDLSALLGPRYCVRRRRFLPTISVRKDGTPAGDVEGVRVQWRQTAGDEWQDVRPDVTIRVLDRECGIRFDDVVLPPELREAVQIRVTATLRGDKRLTYRAIAQNSINPFRVPLVLDLPERFCKKTIAETSSYREEAVAADLLSPLVIAAGGVALPVNQAKLNAAEVDDTKRIREFAEAMLNTWNQATVEGEISLPALDWTGYELGNRIRGIALRNIRWPVHHVEPRFPQIVGITYDVPRQQMTLHLDTPREGIPPESIR